MRYGVFGTISNQLDLPTIAFWLFLLFFISLVFWIQRETKREGYPLKASPFTTEQMAGFPPPPSQPATYILSEGGTTQAPHYYPQPPTSAVPVHQFDGTPLAVVGNPLTAAIGPGAWVRKNDAVLLNDRHQNLLSKLSLLHEWSIERSDSDPRGMKVFDWRWNAVGHVSDCWVDTGSKIVRYLVVDLDPAMVPSVRQVIVPIYHTVIKERAREVRVTALWTHQFADVPMPAESHEMTGQEEERLNAYFAAGRFYRDDPMTMPPSGTQR